MKSMKKGPVKSNNHAYVLSTWVLQSHQHLPPKNPYRLTTNTCVSSRRYLALCVGETRVRIDLQEPLKPQVTQNHDRNASKTPLSPSTLRFLSQVGFWTHTNICLGLCVICWHGIFLLYSCCHSTLAPWMWWCWTCCCQSPSGTWQALLSLYCSITNARGTKLSCFTIIKKILQCFMIDSM